MRKNSEQAVVTRIAPSPTGNLHVGTARSALFNFLYARHMGGSFILRIEDTDKERSKKEYEDDILRGLEWFGLSYDELYYQSKRGDVYTNFIQQLLETDAAYRSKEPSKQDPNNIVEVIRLRNPGKTVVFEDEIRGEISFDTAELGDFVIARSESEPLYHLAVVIDDEDMGVTHVIRGEDHISNTPRQILIQEALSFARPVYAHLPLILAPDRSKLSKRKGVVSVSEYAKDYLPEALVNYLALLGWNPGDEREIFSLEELIDEFSLEKIHKGGAIFSTEKLQSINGAYIKRMEKGAFAEIVLEQTPERIKNLPLYSQERIHAISPLLQERVERITEINERLEEGEYDFFFQKPTVSTDSLAWKDDEPTVAATHLRFVYEALRSLVEPFEEEEIKQAIWQYADDKGRGSVLWPLRYALTGMERSPDPFTTAAILGQEETLSRIQAALEQLEQ